MSIDADEETREQEAIEAGRSIEQILNEPAFITAVRAVEKDCLADFTEADTDEKRRQVWAKTRALQDLLIELKAGVGRGRIANAQRSNRETVEDRARRVNTRKS